VGAEIVCNDSPTRQLLAEHLFIFSTRPVRLGVKKNGTLTSLALR